MLGELVASSRSLEVLFGEGEFAYRDPPLKIPVNVSHVEPRDEKVVCRLVKDEPRFEELSLKLNNFYSNETFRKNISQIQKEGLYAAEVDSLWYRVQLKRICRADKCCYVYLIDVGGTVELPLISLYALDNWFTAQPFNRRYGIEFRTPNKCWPSFAGAGFLNCSDVKKGDELEAYVLSRSEPLLALFKEATAVKKECETKSIPTWRVPALNRIQMQENIFSKSLTLQSLKNIGFSQSLNLGSSFSKSNLLNCTTSNVRSTFENSKQGGTKEALMNGPFWMHVLPYHKNQQNNVLSGRQSSDVKSRVSSVSSVSSHNTDSTSRLDFPVSENDLQFVAKVLNANNAFEIYIETDETASRMKELKWLLKNVNLDSLLPISSSQLTKGDELLYLSENNELQRVRFENSSSEEIVLKCIDTGEEIYLGDKEECLFRLPDELSRDRVQAACLGPLKLDGTYSPNWMTVNSGIRLRELCETVVSARFVDTDQERHVKLFDADGRSINKIFDVYTRTSPALRRNGAYIDNKLN